MPVNQPEPFQIPQIPVANDLTLADLRNALGKGWADYKAQPLFGMFFAAFYIAGGLALSWLLATRGSSIWLIPAASGFPLIAPFTAVGLYEVSRRREAGLPLSWGAVLGALRGRGDDQLLMIGGFVFVGFTFWMILAHGIFAIFMATSGVGGESLALFQTSAGLGMLAVGTLTGALMAFLFYAVTVISLPLLVDKDIDFLTAIIKSLRAVQLNQMVMVLWALTIGAALFAAMVPAFLGLLVVLPVLGHATWHLYRRVVG
ncbi:MAG: hypothetical protein C0515_07645 [Novosphingobium sp.]|nr:hypothetical protein [Novosphingobium sp.]